MNNITRHNLKALFESGLKLLDRQQLMTDIDDKYQSEQTDKQLIDIIIQIRMIGEEIIGN